MYEEIAERLHTMVKVNVYEKYGWAQVAYMTDAFGGTYAIFHVDLNTGETVLNYHEKNELTIENFEMFEKIVKENMEEMLKNRDMNYITEMINSEY